MPAFHGTPFPRLRFLEIVQEDCQYEDDVSTLLFVTYYNIAITVPGLNSLIQAICDAQSISPPLSVSLMCPNLERIIWMPPESLIDILCDDNVDETLSDESSVDETLPESIINQTSFKSGPVNALVKYICMLFDTWKALERFEGYIAPVEPFKLATGYLLQEDISQDDILPVIMGDIIRRADGDLIAWPWQPFDKHTYRIHGHSWRQVSCFSYFQLCDTFSYTL